jgi:hypothetical protein
VLLWLGDSPVLIQDGLPLHFQFVLELAVKL